MTRVGLKKRATGLVRLKLHGCAKLYFNECIVYECEKIHVRKKLLRSIEEGR